MLAEPHEHAEPSWGPGQRSFAWSPDARAIALSRNEDGFGRLVVVVARGDGAARRALEGLARRPRLGRARASRASAPGGRTAPQVTVLDRRPARATRVGAARRPSSTPHDLPEPTPITWPGADGATVHGLLWLPPRRAGERRRTRPPPLLVDVHGGPTDQATVDWKPRIRWFVSRGWAVLSPNYRGSTGYGRAYRHALDHAWGDDRRRRHRRRHPRRSRTTTGSTRRASR